EAIKRLQELVRSAIIVPKLRKASQPSRNSQKRRLDSKTKRSQIKANRGNITE
ncbi:MAG: aminoacyl-tRNA hydrolase, partial [Tatlockia sp.]|nr:aminoacyl-tRNA hydrolase [Tatlockia sp.]